MKNKLSDNSLMGDLVNSLLLACGLGLIIAFLISPFIAILDVVFNLFDNNMFVENPLEPFRVALVAGFLGSLVTSIFLVVLRHLEERKNKN